MKINSKWIWLDREAAADTYGEFYDRFLYEGGKAELRISADSNYAVYVNGKLADSGQYPDFPHYKVYDTLDLTPYVRVGENHLGITVWYYGKSNMGYFPGKAALRYELWQGENCLCSSGEETLSRLSPAYQNGRQKNITGQLGFGYGYDFRGEDNWLLGEKPDTFQPSRVVEQELPLNIRPIPKCVIGQPLEAVCVAQDGNHFLFDLGRETVGYLNFSVVSHETQQMTVAYGEHIIDGGVRRKIHNRDFSVDFVLRPGKNEFFNPFRRFGCRYLEVFSEKPMEVSVMTLRPVDYPVQCTGKLPSDPLRRRIYETSVRTLQLCIHDHYEDTPWREQALYAMDSRNQMLCGYYAFREYRLPRASLHLMSQDRRRDGLLSICVPSNDDLTIPSFSLHYFTEVYEYTRYSGDQTLVREIWPKLQEVLQTFISRMDTDLVPAWTGKEHWNFYEWSQGLEGALGKSDTYRFDAALNCLFSSALQTMQKLADLLGIPADYQAMAQQVNEAIRRRFLNSDGLCVNSSTDPDCSELVNGLAILCGAAHGAAAEKIAEKLASAENGLTPITLSMACFKYDALLKVDTHKYRAYILSDIDRKYGKMLDAGATSFWETELGAADFDGAGSLCHAWSAMPVYYYSILD